MNKRAMTTATKAEIASSADFRAFVESQSLEAQRRRDDRLAEIEDKRTSIARSKSDHENYATRVDGEIADLLEQVDDENQIIEAAERALSIARPAPLLQSNTPVTDALNGVET